MTLSFCVNLHVESSMNVNSRNFRNLWRRSEVLAVSFQSISLPVASLFHLSELFFLSLFVSFHLSQSFYSLSLSLMDVMWGLNGEIDQTLCVEAVRLLGLCERRLFPKLLQPPDACQKTLSVKVRLALSLSLPLPPSLFVYSSSFLLCSCQATNMKFPYRS